MTLGEYIRAARRRVGLKQYELAAKVGTSPHTISHIELGSRGTSDTTLDAIAAALGLNRAYLYYLLGRFAPDADTTMDEEIAWLGLSYFMPIGDGDVD